jgi:ribokinase
LISIPGAILCTGNLVQDTVVYPCDQIPTLGTQWVERIEQHLGGNGASSSYTIAKLGGKVRLMGWVGDDAFGRQLRDLLESVRVDLSFLSTASREGTSASVALVRTDGSRGFLNYPGASREAFENFAEFTSQHVAGCSHYHLANPFSLAKFRGKAAMALQSARNQGLTTSMDLAWDSLGDWMRIVEPCLPLTDLLFANEDEIRMLTGHVEPDKAAAAFRDCGASNIVVKLGPRGSRTILAKGTTIVTPAFQVKAIDTTGAGDCFVGAYLAGLQHGYVVDAAARLANAVGALSASRIGAVPGLRSLPDTLAWISDSERATSR